MLSASVKPEIERLQSTDSHIDSEKTAAELVIIYTCTSNPQFRTNEQRTSDCPCRIFNLSDYFAFWANPQHTSLAINGLPDVTLGIYLEAIWLARRVQLPKRPRIGNRTIRGGVVVCNEALLGGVLKEERFLIKRPADSIGDRQRCGNYLASKISVKAKESPYKVLKTMTFLDQLPRCLGREDWRI